VIEVEGYDRGAQRIARVDQLQHADHAVFVVDHGDGEERLAAILIAAVEGDRAREVEAARVVGVRDVDHALVHRAVAGHVLGQRLALRAVEGDLG
jgi:hypothetical protein